MGSSKTLKLKGQPNKIFTDGNSSQGRIGSYDDSGNIDENSIDELIVELIRLNPDVLEQASSGDKVTVNQLNDGFGVDIRFGRLGYVPPHYETIVKQKRLFGGVIVEIGQKPISVSVLLSNR
jgi:hypothetical protein